MNENIEPRLIINLTEEEKQIQGIIRELGADGLITMAQSVAPERDFTENSLDVAKDVIQNLLNNGGKQTFCVVPNTPPQYIESNTGLSPDRVAIDY